MSKLKAFAFLIAALIYIVFPTDLLPDFMPLVGYLDDLIVFFTCFWLFWRQWRAGRPLKRLALPKQPHGQQGRDPKP